MLKHVSQSYRMSLLTSEAILRSLTFSSVSNASMIIGISAGIDIFDNTATEFTRSVAVEPLRIHSRRWSAPDFPSLAARKKSTARLVGVVASAPGSPACLHVTEMRHRVVGQPRQRGQAEPGILTRRPQDRGLFTA